MAAMKFAPTIKAFGVRDRIIQTLEILPMYSALLVVLMAVALRQKAMPAHPTPYGRVPHKVVPSWPMIKAARLLPEWLLAFGEVSPPKWVLQDDIPVWLKAGEIPEWLHDGSEVASMHRWLYAVDGKWPEWMSDSKNFPPWINKIADEGEAYVNEDEL